MDLLYNAESKSDEKSKAFREEGNELYKKKNYIEALFSYNKCITFAKSKEVLSLGFGNRSAVYFELECYEECLKNIQWARENNYPKVKLAKLDKREENCKIMLQQHKINAEDPWDFFKLSYPANKKIPWVGDCVEVHTTKKYGRGIYATKNLKAGAIISVEESLINILDGDALYRHCYNCFKTCMMNLIPCVKTASFMFCSTGCMDKFCLEIEDENFVLNKGTKIIFPFCGYKELHDFIIKTDLNKLNKTIFDFDFSDPSHPDFKRNLMTCLLSLPTTIKADNVEPLHKIRSKAVSHFIAIMDQNLFQTIYHSRDKLKPVFLDGYNISLLRSLINHSCVANVKFINVDNKIVAIVQRPVKAGEQLFFCYYKKFNPNHKMDKMLMEKEHNFKCECQECIEDSYHFKDIKISMPKISMDKNCFILVKNILKNAWKKINCNTESKKCIEKNLLATKHLIFFVAYYATFPN